MKKGVILIIGLAVAVVFANCKGNSEENQEAVVLKNTVDSLSYCLGINIGDNLAMNLSKSPVDSLNLDMLTKGFITAYKKETGVIDQQGAMMFLDSYFGKLMEKETAAREEQFKENKTAGENFLAENGKRKEVVTLPSGVQYEIIKAGKGEKPKPSDIIKAHYVGKLVDGTVFDASKDEAAGKNEPLVIQLQQLIPGWIEAIQLMPVGSTWKIYIPSEMGYGDQDKGIIKPFSALVFEVELLGIEQPK